MRSIAVQLGRAPSSISREIKRNGGQECYRASQAEESAWDRGRRPKTCKLAQNRALARIVAGKLQRRWSPQQVAGWLKRTYPDDTSRQVSPETIYRSLFIQARGALKKELVEHLRRSPRPRPAESGPKPDIRGWRPRKHMVETLISWPAVLTPPCGVVPEHRGPRFRRRPRHSAAGRLRYHEASWR
jgi:IS30 family transposase